MMKQEPSLNLLSISQVIDKTALSRASVYRLLDTGDFPSPLRIGPRRVAWVNSEIDSWIRSRQRTGRDSQKTGEAGQLESVR